MNTESIRGNDSWSEFMKLANVARVRNAGFNLPLARKNRSVVETIKNTHRNILQKNAISGNAELYSDRTDYKKLITLGTRFDVYV